MKKKLLFFLIFSLFIISHQTYAQDSDGDGTANNLDQDEDNDGVPDELDGCSTIDIANTIGIGSPIVNNSTYSIEETNITYTTNNATAFYGYVAGNQGNAIRVQGPGLSNAQLQMSFSTPVQNLTFKMTDFDDNEEITVNAYDENNNLLNLSATNVPFLGSFVARSGNLIQATSAGTNSEGDDDVDDVTGAAYLYFSGQISRISFTVDIANNSSIRITEFNYCLKDSDNDNVLDFMDIDSDNDGIPDTVESGGVDTDGDGYVDNIIDNNGNGIPDIYDFSCTNGVSASGYATTVDGSTNTSNANNALNSGDQSYANINSGGTLELQFNDIIPAGNNIVIRHERFSGTGQISFNIERSLDGITYFNSETFLTSFNSSYEVLSYDLIGGDTQYIKITNLSTETLGIDYAKYNFGANSNCSGINGQQILNLDTDNDGLTNAQDLDSDGDGIYDIIEANSIDSNGDGLADGYTDTDGDGFNDNFDGDVGNDGIAENTASAFITTGTDTDSDGIPNSYNNANTDNSGFPNPYDIDADDDGIPDNVEAQLTKAYLVPAAGINASGINNAYPSSLTLIDTDGDGIFDYLDSDTDNDGTPDIQENGDVNILSNLDSDLDGLDNNFDSNNASFDVNDEVSVGDIADLTLSFGDVDADTPAGGDLDYRDIFDTNPPSSASIDFDGVDDYTEVINSMFNGLSEFTISFWFKYEGPTLNTSEKVFLLGQKDVFEISIGDWSSGGPNNPVYNSVSAKVFNGPGTGLGSGWRFNRSDWTNLTLTVSQNGSEISFRVYRNGYTSPGSGTITGTLNSSSEPFRMGIISGSTTFNNFEGWIDEVKVFNKALTEDQVQRMIYQEIQESASNNVEGSIIPKEIVDSSTNSIIPWNELQAYYPMTNILTNRASDESSNDNDLALYNITTILPQTAPLPFETQADGDWTNEATWLHGDVWGIEDLPIFTPATQSSEPYSIVQIHDIVTTSRSHRSIGLFIDDEKKLTVTGDNEINNSWYLQLDGTIDLADDSQLVQGVDSDLVTDDDGKILRRQEGNLNYFWYNYWTSPVGALAATNNTNTDFSISMLKDGPGISDFVEFTSSHNEVGKISTRWLYKYQNGQTYWNWTSLTPSSSIEPGVGYTHKGINNANGDQQYIFEGKPNNGVISLTADDVDGDSANEHSNVLGMYNYTSTLIGNPYPSALDAEKFIADNPSVISGAVYIWEQWAGISHNLEEYEGGYGTINMGSVAPAYQWNDPASGTDPLAKTPTPFIPVGQGFFVEVVADTGTIEFNNSQRVFKREALGESVFFRNSDSENSTASTEENPMDLIRLELRVSNGNKRNFVLLFGGNTTDGFDYGYDARTIDPQDDDISSLLEGEKMVIQSFAPITEDKVVDLVFNSTGTHNYTLEMIELENIPEDQEVYLRDNLTDTYFDLKSGTYSFSSNFNGEDTDRFDIVFQSGSTLSNEEFANDGTIIFVNNTENMLYVKGLSTQAKQLDITNMLGQNIRSFNNINNQALESGLDVSDLSSGVYVISIQTENNLTIDKKIIID